MFLQSFVNIFLFKFLLLFDGIIYFLKFLLLFDGSNNADDDEQIRPENIEL